MENSTTQIKLSFESTIELLESWDKKHTYLNQGENKATFQKSFSEVTKFLSHKKEERKTLCETMLPYLLGEKDEISLRKESFIKIAQPTTSINTEINIAKMFSGTSLEDSGIIRLPVGITIDLVERARRSVNLGKAQSCRTALEYLMYIRSKNLDFNKKVSLDVMCKAFEEYINSKSDDMYCYGVSEQNNEVIIDLDELYNGNRLKSA